MQNIPYYSRHLMKALSCLIGFLALVGCEHGQKVEKDIPQQLYAGNAIYHWKNKIDLTASEQSFLKRHHIGRIYVRFFDVTSAENGRYKAIPTATVEFTSQLPDSIEVVPTVYITTEAMEGMTDSIDFYAEKLYGRIMAMASANHIKNVREVQLDCDWTETLRDDYFNLCRSMKSRLQERGIKLSSTIRLHQLRQQAPPVDFGVLMLYNVADVKRIETQNSILTLADVAPYLKGDFNYPLPLSFAYPAFSWSVVFRDNHFERLCNIPHDTLLNCNRFERLALNRYPGKRYEVEQDIAEYDLKAHDIVRYEQPDAEEIIYLKSVVEEKLGKQAHANIIYHLDEKCLNQYTTDQIQKIYAR